MIAKKLFCGLFTISCVIDCFVRGQYYINDGVIKFVAGIGLPINVNMPGGSLSWFNNVQVFYKLPDNITYYEPYKIMQKRSAKSTFIRPTVYRALSNYLERFGFSGSECLNWCICEISRQKINWGGLFGDVFYTLFSSQDDFAQHKNALWQGLHNNSDCEAIYTDCLIEKDSIFLI